MPRQIQIREMPHIHTHKDTDSHAQRHRQIIACGQTSCCSHGIWSWHSYKCKDRKMDGGRKWGVKKILGVVLYCSSMGCLRLVRSLKLIVSFAQYRLFYRALLQNRPIISRSLLIVATPQCFGMVQFVKIVLQCGVMCCNVPLPRTCIT